MSLERAFNRRDVLKMTGGTVASLATTKLHPLESFAAERCENDREVNRNILVVDFAPYGCHPRFLQEVQFTNSDLLTRLAINGTVPDDKRWIPNLIYAVANPLRKKGSEASESVMNKIPLSNTFERMLEDRLAHGEIVADVLGNALAAKGHNDRVLLHPIQQLYESVRSGNDEEGNKTLFAKMSTEAFIEALYNYPESNIVNLSWQVGEVGLKTEQNGLGPPDLVVLGAYRKEAALANLTELAKICNAHDNKLFVCASGNFGDEIGETKAILEAQGLWPTNLLIVAEASPGTMEITPFLKYPFSASGADIAIDSQHPLYNPNGEIGSTVATAIATSVAFDYKQKYGLNTPEEIIAKILSNCRRVPHYDGKSQMLVLDPDREALYSN